MSKYSEAIIGDRAVILRDGEVLSFDEILSALRDAETAKNIIGADAIDAMLETDLNWFSDGWLHGADEHFMIVYSERLRKGELD